MGTLTAASNRLPGYCDHKLPTSCRLSSIPECCACADERAHSASYSKYIDGVGFVPLGTRWDRYCWYCREFWEKRVQASGLRPAQTRIPEVPDQTEFLDRWYEFHRGYRIVKREDGSEERVAVLGEPFRDVDPGCLPRTLEEMRAGRAASAAVRQQEQANVAQGQDEVMPSLEDTLDQMFEAAAEEDRPSQPAQQRPDIQRLFRDFNADHQPASLRADLGGGSSFDEPSTRSIHAQAMVPTGSRNREYQNRRIAALRRELHRMRNGIERVISGLRDLGEQVPDQTEATTRLTNLGQTLDAIDGPPSREEAERAIGSVNALTSSAGMSQTDRTMAVMQARVDEARQHFDEARRNRDQAVSELDVADQEFRTSQQILQHLQREQRSTENYIRLFGTREEIAAQGEQYESPIGGMFNRAYERFRAAEGVRQEERTLRRVLEDEAREGGETQAQRLAELEARERDVWGVPRPATQRPESEQEAEEPRGELEEYYALLRRQNWGQQVPRSTTARQEIDGNGLSTPSAPGAPLLHSSEVEAAETSGPERLVNGVPEDVLDEDEAARMRQDIQDDLDDARAQYVAPDPLNIPDGWRFDADQILARLVARPGMVEGPRYPVGDFRDMRMRHGWDELNEHERDWIGPLLNPRSEVFWDSGVVAARFARRRALGEMPVLLPNRPSTSPTSESELAENTEIMAEAFQQSAELRRRAPGLTGMEQLHVLYRLQAGERRMEDVRKLQEMLQDPETFDLAARIHTTGRNHSEEVQAEVQQVMRERQEAARQGDHSRQELDAQRRATQAFAVAAGRTAMQTGPQALIEQMADRDEETRAAYNRLRENGWVPTGNTPNERLLQQTQYRPLDLVDFASPSDSESDAEERDAQGLDAKETGRPEAKTDEEMKVSMECRICYTQLAEIACLPCGHLVMCKWCSEQHSPVMAHDRTRPRRAAGCPVCRKSIRQKVRVFRA